MSIYTNLMSEKTDAISPALRQAKKAFAPVIKNKQAYGYKYADFASCVEAIEDALYNNGIVFTQLESKDEDKQLVVVTKLLHDSGQWIQSVSPVESVAMKQCNATQQRGAGLTYTKRYALCGILGIATEDDDARSMGRQTEKAAIREVVASAAELTRKFMSTCEAAGIDDIKGFASFAGVSRDNLDSIAGAIENFESLKATYQEVISAAA